MVPVTTRTVWGSLGLQLESAVTRWPKRCVSVPCAVTMPLGTTTVCGPARAARRFLREASKVGNMYSSYILEFGKKFGLFKCNANIAEKYLNLQHTCGENY